MMYDMGMPPREIAAKEGVPVDSIRGIAKRYRVQKSAQSSPRPGRPPVISEREKRVIMRIIAQDPFVKAKEIIIEAGLCCCERTLTRWLKNQGIQHLTALRRPKLTEENAQKRLQFARAHILQSQEIWKRWIFSDETSVARGDGERQKWVFCKRVSVCQPISLSPLTRKSLSDFIKKMYNLG